LGDLGFPQFFKAQDAIPDVIIRKRARHVISENQRVLASVSCLLKNDLPQFGVLMNVSHDSLRDDYEGNRLRIGFACEEARKIPGVWDPDDGCWIWRMHVSLVTESVVPHFIEKLVKNIKLKPDSLQISTLRKFVMVFKLLEK